MHISPATFHLHILMCLLVKQTNFSQDTFLQFLNCVWGVVCKTVHVKPTDSEVIEVLNVLTLHHKYYLYLHCTTSIICTYTAPQVLSVPTLHNKYYLYLHCTTSIICTYTAQQVLSVPTLHNQWTKLQNLGRDTRLTKQQLGTQSAVQVHYWGS